MGFERQNSGKEKNWKSKSHEHNVGDTCGETATSVSHRGLV